MSAESVPAPLTSAEVSLKLFVDDHSVVQPLELITVFQRWITEGALEDELTIDVANYEHVPQGPGIALICDKAHYYFDVRENRWGLRYRGRREARATGAEAVADAFGRALWAASLLENDPQLEGRYRFRTDQVEFGIYDRLRAPSAEATLEAVRSDLEGVIEELYGAAPESLELVSGPREPFMVAVVNGLAPSVEELLARLAPARG